MPGKKEKKKSGHFMSYFRHKLLYLKDAWKKKSRPLYVIRVLIFVQLER